MTARTFAAVCGVALLLCAAGPLAPRATAQPRSTAADEGLLGRAPQILVIFSDDASQSWIRNLTDALNAAEYGPQHLAPAWYFEHLDAIRFQGGDYERNFRDALRDKYRNRRLDLILPVSSNAITFVRSVHDDLWPQVRVLAANYAGRALALGDDRPWESILTFEAGREAVVATIRQLFPDLTTMAVAAGVSTAERQREAPVVAEFRGLGLTVVDVEAASLAAMAEKVRALPPDTVLLLAGGQVEANGRAVSTWRMCDALSAAANRPTIMLGAQFLGCGILGGSMRDYSKVGRLIAEHAMALVAAGGPRTQVVPFAAIATLSFDARQLERWRIDESRLPAGSVVAFRAPSLWRDYRRTAGLAAVGLVTQFLLIGGLLYERRQRQKAEVDSRRSLAVAAHADRRAAVTALTGSIAHELNQPLGSILHNAEAAEMMLAADTATLDDLRTILGDIRKEDRRAVAIIQRHRTLLKKGDVERQPVDVGMMIAESLRVLAHDAIERQVQIETDLGAAPGQVLGDAVLLQQVIVNLVMNAMDAMAPLPASRHRVGVSMMVGRDSVGVEVRDSGPGVPPDLERVLFEPFITTKPQGIGIGLTIARGIVEAHGGTIEVRNNPEGGATFRLALPAVGAA
jgi:signal transduction histidine kinase